ncbi:MAG: hypothetical protein ABI642_05095 [Polaromonas sp.]
MLAFSTFCDSQSEKTKFSQNAQQLAQAQITQRQPAVQRLQPDQPIQIFTGELDDWVEYLALWISTKLSPCFKFQIL